ncbi:YcxB family protein [Argonema galeatum]|uniref:YcxB family protein n=1 Tax=Argonema galeatum TaxID=2942762 RepID=UPI00201178D5|nr:YcxB family protein [Argonema galeatum]MCL1467316.1 hypothetical protein [Argonema galeatum A003/A1]
MQIISREYRWTIWDLFKDMMNGFIVILVVILIAIPISIRLSLFPFKVFLSLLVPMFMVIVLFVSFLALALILQENNRAYKGHQFEISEAGITLHFVDDSRIEIDFGNIQRLVKRRSYYFIVSQKEFYYLPLNAFASKDDIYRFNSLLKKK